MPKQTLDFLKRSCLLKFYWIKHWQDFSGKLTFFKQQADYERSSSDRNYDWFGDGFALKKHCAYGSVKSIGHKSRQTCRATALNRSEFRNRGKSQSTGPDPSKWMALNFVKLTEFFIDLGHASRDTLNMANLLLVIVHYEVVLNEEIEEVVRI